MHFSTRRQAIAAMTVALAFPWDAAYAADRPSDPVENFYNTLLDSMRHAQELKVQGRYAKLEPVMLQSFDVPAMTRLAVGHTFETLSPEDQRRLEEAFGKLLVATFASDFDDFKGETFTIDDQVNDQGGDKLVSTKFHPAGAPVDLNYRVHRVGGQWRILDVYLNGTISQLATWHATFVPNLRQGGPEEMLQAIKKQTDRDMAAI